MREFLSAITFVVFMILVFWNLLLVVSGCDHASFDLNCSPSTMRQYQYYSPGWRLGCVLGARHEK